MPFVCDVYTSTLLEKAVTELSRRVLSTNFLKSVTKNASPLREIINFYLLVTLSFLQKGFNATSYEI
jgi:hypothetical protein